MQPTWWETLEAVKPMFSGLKTANVNSQMMLTTFDSTDCELLHRDEPIADWSRLMDEPIAGYFTTTPLYDAINLMGRKLQKLDPPRCAITIVTDGEEMGSQFTNLTQAKAILDWCRAKGWQITFIGAEFDNARLAATPGLQPKRSDRRGPQAPAGRRPRPCGEAQTLRPLRRPHALYG